MKTDNEFQAQYIRDDFDLINDTIYSYRYFKNEALLAISLEINSISEESKGFDFQERRKKENNEWETDQEYEEHRYDFWGEDKPIVGDLFKENIIEQVFYIIVGIKDVIVPEKVVFIQKYDMWQVFD